MIPEGCSEVALNVFGGVNYSLGPTDLPSGLSPGCVDVAFAPGTFYTRPPLQRESTLGTTAQIVYKSTYVKPNGTVSQFEADSNGGMYMDGVQIGQTKAGNRFSTCNAFGKLYIATSDGLHGADVPLQWNGTYLDRVSQDGPAAPPTVQNYSIAPTSLATGSSATPVAITTITPTSPVSVQTGGGGTGGGGTGGGGGGGYPGGGGGYRPDYTPPSYTTYYTQWTVVTSAAHGLTVNQTISIAGDSPYNTSSANVLAVLSTTSFTVSAYQTSNAVGTGGTVTGSSPLLQRAGNQVTANTSSANNLLAGYQVVISGVPDASTSISSIVINNETLSGLATVTTASPHGLAPDETVSISNVQPANIGGGINTYAVNSGTATVVTNTAHGLQVGSYVLVQFSGGVLAPWTVNGVPSATSFTFSGITGSPSGSGGIVELNWPLPSGTQIEIQSTPTATTFTFAITFTDGTWSSGNYTFPWNGTFYVTSVSSATQFTYAQNGPNAILASGSGTVTPQGQISPGQRNAVCIFVTRTGYTTRPSTAAITATAGNQYLLVSQIPIGPANVVARIIAFTGANGGAYYYLPVAPRDPSGSYLIGTSTQINDNTSTTAIFDFTDDALFAATAIGIPGNNLFNQVILGPCLNFYGYASRLFAWGSRNRIQQYQNMGFEGGTLSGSTQPLYWTAVGTGLLVPGDYGMGWQITGGGTGTDGQITQPAYLDQFGIPILTPLTQYTFNLWLKGSASATMDFYSPTVGVLATANVAATAAGGFGQGNFNALTPAIIPPDTVIRVYATGLTAGQTLILDELEQVYTANPYLLAATVSYIENPEAFDGVTGVLGPDDPQPVMGMTKNANADVLAVLTFGPKGSLYICEDTASGEPATWNLRHVSSVCGLISTWGIAEFEQWFIWASDTGERIYDGGSVDKLSQEIQPVWDSINPAARQFTVIRNDSVTRRVYTLLCTGTASQIPNTTYVMDYRELNSAGAISNSGTLHVSNYSGKIVTTDLTRKWTPWTMALNYCETLLLSTGQSVMVFCGGTGGALTDVLHSATYTLDEKMIPGLANGTTPGTDGHNVGIDADYGAYWQNSVYPTYFFVGQDQAQALQLGAHRLLHQFMSINAVGVGSIVSVPYANRLDNPSPSLRAIPLSIDLPRDIYIGLNVAGERVSYKYSCQPAGARPFASTAPAGFQIFNLSVAMRVHPYSPVRQNGLAA